MRGITVHFKAEGAVLEFDNAVEDFNTTVQNAVVFVGQKTNSDKTRPDKGTTLHQDGVGGGLHNAGIFKHALRALASRARLFSLETDDLENNPSQLERFTLDLDEWLADAARIKVGARASTGEEITTDYVVS